MTFCSAVRQKFFEKTVVLPTIYQNLRYQFFFTFNRVPLPVSSVLWDTKNFSTELWCHHPHPALLWMTIFDTRSFLKYRCVPLRYLSLVWKKSSTVNGEILFWCIKFSIPEIFWNTERLHDEVYQHYETQNESEKPVMLPRPTMRENFRYKIFLSNQRKALIRFSTALWDEKLSTENRDTPILCMNFVRYPKIFETPKCSPL